MFSRRTPAASSTNRLTRALAARTRPYLDLTASNPTAVGLDLTPPLHLLSDPHGGRYEPDPRGLRSAREAVAGWYAERGVPVSPDRIVLSASSSEAYGWLLKLLAEPGDVVLVPAPSYPLLDALAGLESVELHRYPLDPADGWRVHASAVEEALLRVERLEKRVAAVVLVGPNNPTGTSLRRVELHRLLDLACRHGFAVISDEVFLDYRWDDGPDDVRVAAASSGALVFSLGGLSKAAALPQLKLGWIVANGPPALLHDALHRLEWIADAYLSVGTPVQRALPGLLDWSTCAVTAVRARIESNRDTLAATFPAGGPVSLLPHRGGWSAVLRVPAVLPEEELVLGLLDSADTLVHPGYFYDFPFEAFLVMSLITAQKNLEKAVARTSTSLQNSQNQF